jgi:hypothetical protein
MAKLVKNLFGYKTQQVKKYIRTLKRLQYEELCELRRQLEVAQAEHRSLLSELASLQPKSNPHTIANPHLTEEEIEALIGPALKEEG